MKRYRIKQANNRFYPQYKKRFGWGYYKGKPYWDYNLMLEKYIAFENLYFESFEEANKFLLEQENYDRVAYYDIIKN